MSTIKATHCGSIDLGGGPIPCFVLETGMRVIGTKQIQALLGASEGRNLRRSLARIDSKNKALDVSPTVFVHEGVRMHGFDAEDVVNILRAYQRGFLRGSLHESQIPMAKAAMAAIEAFAAVGLVRLIDDASGYQAPIGEAKSIWERIYRGEKAAWEEKFDSDWDRSLCRLYGHPYEGRPPFFVRSLNYMVYRWTFGEEAAKKLKETNPNPRHRSNHHQHLTDEANIKLSQTINTVRGITKLSRGPKDFMRKLHVVFGDVSPSDQLGLDW